MHASRGLLQSVTGVATLRFFESSRKRTRGVLHCVLICYFESVIKHSFIHLFIYLFHYGPNTRAGSGFCSALTPYVLLLYKR